MNVIPRNILSGLLTVMFAVVSITGVMMFFKIRVLSSEALHIWGPFRILCQSGKITNTQGHRYEDRNRRRAICSRY